MESENSSQLSTISLDGLTLPVSSQNLENMLVINSQGMIDLDINSQELSGGLVDQNNSMDFLELSSQQMRDLIPGEYTKDDHLDCVTLKNKDDAEYLNDRINSDSDEELVAVMVDFEKKSTSSSEDGFQCQQCKKKYKHKSSLIKHTLSTHNGNRYQCLKCDKTFSTSWCRKRHELKCKGKADRAPKRKSEEPEPSTSKRQRTPPSPKRTLYRCRLCEESFENRRELFAHRMRIHYQVGQGLQFRPWGNNPAPWEFDGGETDEAFRDVYETNEPLILEQHQRGPIESRYNFPVKNDVTVDDMMHFVSDIYEEQQYAFRLNLIFGVILQNRETGEYRYFAPYSNFEILEDPVFISRRTDLRKLQRILHRKDIMTTILANRPDTKWIPVLLCNIIFRVTTTNYPVGAGQTLPDYIRDKRSIYSLLVDVNTRKPYEDNLCAFRCLALHKGHAINSIEKPAQEMFKQWCSFKKSNKKFHGVAYDEFPEFESFFKVNMEVYSLQDDDSCRSIYKSRGRFDTTMYVNLYENHLSYIINFPQFANKFQCSTCDRHFNHLGMFKTHQKICTNKTKYIYPGKFYKMSSTLFEKLEEFGINVPLAERTFPWFICFDFESILEIVEDQQTPNLQWTRKHVPVSVSLCSNIHGHTEAECIIDSNQDQLVKTMVDKMIDIAADVKKLATDKWDWVDKAIREKMSKDECTEQESDGENKDEEREPESQLQDNSCKPLEDLQIELNQYMTQVPVLGFNSSNYDLNLIKQHIAKHLNMQGKGTFTVKKNNSYTCLSIPELKFLDISQFLAAGSSYSSFLKAYKVEEKKGYFPYEWFDAVGKLEHPELPPHAAFHSTLKNKNITLEEYEYCQKVWKEKKMSKFREFLEWYNNLDVKPFVTAVERLQQFYFKEGIDVFKAAISVPGLARNMLFKCAKQQGVNFALCDKTNADLYQTIKNGIVGGPSIIFKRYAKKGITRIRGGRPCQSVVGYDANALYLWAINQHMPTGPFIRRTAPEFIPEVRDRFMAAYHWMDFLMHTSDVNIQHQLNSGREVRVGRYPVDGFQVNGPGGKPVVYQFHGCYFHGHSCTLTHNIKDKNWLDTRDKKYKKTQEITNYLKASGCHVVEKWECQYRDECQRNPNITQFINSTRPSFYRKHRGKVTEYEILKAVVEEELFGIIEVDITVPDQWMSTHHPSMTPYEYFQEMCPLFCNTRVPFESIGDHMKEHVEQHNLSKHDRHLLVAGLSAEKILLATPLLRWYLQKGLVVSRIYQVVEYQKQRCFTDFVNKVSSCRRNADENPDTSIIADTMKVIGNSAYGSLIMDKTKHRNIVYVQGENKTCLKVNEPLFRKLECLDMEEEFYELSMAKRLIRLDLPIQLGFFILQYAKLHMLSFYYDFLDKYVDRRDFQLLESDTDSLYLEISSSRLDDIIRPQLRANYQQGLKGFCTEVNLEAGKNSHWLPRTCCDKHSKFDKRTPGLFKLEYQGDEMISLSSKTYIVRKSTVKNVTAARQMTYKLLRKALKLKPRRMKLKPYVTNEYKYSSKGVSKRNIKSPMSIFRQVLKTRATKNARNVGFRARKNTIYSYSLLKRGFGYFYCKRKVLDDGINTVPLNITLCPIPYLKDKEQNNSIMEEDDSDAEPCDFDVFDALVDLL